MYNNPDVLYTRRDNGGYFIVSDHGIAVAEFSDERRLMTHVTFLGDDELTLRKQLIYDEEIKIYKGVLELKRLKLRKGQDDIITIWNIAKKHHAGFEMVKRWYKWNGVVVIVIRWGAIGNGLIIVAFLRTLSINMFALVDIAMRSLCASAYSSSRLILVRYILVFLLKYKV